jgi:hypothetical protein
MIMASGNAGWCARSEDSGPARLVIDQTAPLAPEAAACHILLSRMRQPRRTRPGIVVPIITLASEVTAATWCQPASLDDHVAHRQRLGRIAMVTHACRARLAVSVAAGEECSRAVRLALLVLPAQQPAPAGPRREPRGQVGGGEPGSTVCSAPVHSAPAAAGAHASGIRAGAHATSIRAGADATSIRAAGARATRIRAAGARVASVRRAAAVRAVGRAGRATRLPAGTRLTVRCSARGLMVPPGSRAPGAALAGQAGGECPAVPTGLGATVPTGLGATVPTGLGATVPTGRWATVPTV